MRRLALCMPAVLVQAISSAANATVLEFASDGTVQVTDQHRPVPVGLRVAPDIPPPEVATPLVGGGQYRSLAEAVALRYAGSEGVRAVGLDALSFVRLFSALISVESAYVPTAVSSAGALGLGQLMPDTAAALGVQDPFDPAQNLDGAARYLTAQLARFGSVRLALAAYNAGPERVAAHGGIPPILETQNFVVAVSGRAGIAAGSVDSGSPSVVADEVLAVVEQGPVVETPAVAVIMSEQEPIGIEGASTAVPPAAVAAAVQAVSDNAAGQSVLLDETHSGAVRAVMSWTDQRGASVWEY